MFEKSEQVSRFFSPLNSTCCCISADISTTALRSGDNVIIYPPIACVSLSIYSSDSSSRFTPLRFLFTNCVKKSICSFVRSKLSLHTLFLILPSEVIRRRTYILLPVGITSTFVITENLFTVLVETIAHFVISARALDALSIISSSVAPPILSNIRSISSFSSSGNCAGDITFSI